MVLGYTVPNNINCNHINNCDISLNKMATVGISLTLKKALELTLTKLTSDF